MPDGFTDPENPTGRRLRLLLAALLSALIAAALLLGATPASAATATATDPGIADGDLDLPTAQITGIAWAITTAPDGNTYATGRFSKARPAGIAPGGTGEVSRGNIVAFNTATGKLTSFNHTLNAEGKSITVSKNGATLYVGGLFTTVDGKARSHLAAFDIATGALLPAFASNGPSGNVLALAAAPTGNLYVGGTFSKVGTTARRNLAAYTSTGALTAFNATANGGVKAVVLTPDASKLVVGGSFSLLGTTPAYGLGAVSATTGVPSAAWAATREAFPIRADDIVSSSRAITSLATDGQKVYGSGFNFGGGSAVGAWEGTFAVNPTDGTLIWGNNCHGDTYSVWPMRGILYSASHAHDCTAVGALPETTPRTWHRATASGTTPFGVNVCGAMPEAYTCYAGMPMAPMVLMFLPTLNTGTYSGASQGAWAVTGNPDYVVLGGEFTKVNGHAQQGFTRFKINLVEGGH